MGRRLLLLLPWLWAAPAAQAQVGAPPPPPDAPEEAPVEAPVEPPEEAPVEAPVEVEPTAPAPAVRARLDYDPGPFAARCPTAADLEREIEARLAGDAIAEPAARVVVVTLQGEAEPIAARVELRDVGGAPLGARVLEAPGEGCGELIAAAALAVSIALDPTRALLAEPPPLVVERAPPPPPAPPPSSPPAPPPATVTVLRAPPAAPAVEDDRVVLIAATGLRTSFFRSRAGVEPGVLFGAGARWRWLSLRVESDLGGAIGVGDNGGGLGIAATSVYRLAPCAHLGWLTGCGLLSGGGGGTLFTAAPPAGPDYYAAAGGRLGLDWRIGAYGALRLYGDAEVGLNTAGPPVALALGVSAEGPLP